MLVRGRPGAEERMLFNSNLMPSSLFNTAIPLDSNINGPNDRIDVDYEGTGDNVISINFSPVKKNIRERLQTADEFTPKQLDETPNSKRVSGKSKRI